MPQLYGAITRTGTPTPSSRALHQNPTKRMDYSTCFKTLASIMGLVDVLYRIQAWHHHHRHISALCITMCHPVVRCKIRRCDAGIDVAVTYVYTTAAAAAAATTTIISYS